MRLGCTFQQKAAKFPVQIKRLNGEKVFGKVPCLECCLESYETRSILWKSFLLGNSIQWSVWFEVHTYFDKSMWLIMFATAWKKGQMENRKYMESRKETKRTMNVHHKAVGSYQCEQSDKSFVVPNWKSYLPASLFPKGKTFSVLLFDVQIMRLRANKKW